MAAAPCLTCSFHTCCRAGLLLLNSALKGAAFWCSSCRRMESGAGLSPPSHVTGRGAVGAGEPRTAMGRKIFQDREVARCRNVPAERTCPSHLAGALRHAALAPSRLLPQLSTEGCWTRLEGLQQRPPATDGGGVNNKTCLEGGRVGVLHCSGVARLSLPSGRQGGALGALGAKCEHGSVISGPRLPACSADSC